MSTPAAPEPERRPRLNPFAFPSDTTFRFVLLVVAVLGSTLYVWNWIYYAVGDHVGRLTQASRDCLASAPTQFTGLDDFTASSEAFTSCVQASNRPIAWWMLGGLAFVLGLALVLTLAQPWWRRRRLRLRPLLPEDAPAVVAEIASLAREAGLAGAAHTRLEPARPRPDRARVRVRRELHGRAHRRARRPPGARPRGVQGGGAARARAHPQPRRRPHVLHDLALARLPARRRASVRRHAARRGRLDRDGRGLAHRRAGTARLPDPERRPALARDLCRRARVGARRGGRRCPPRARRAATTQARHRSAGCCASIRVQPSGSPPWRTRGRSSPSIS